MSKIRFHFAFAAGLTLAAIGSASPHAIADEQRDYGEYLAGECVACHSKDTKKAESSGIPPLDAISGWDTETFVEVMKSFQTGERDNAAMINVAKALEADQITALAVYFGSLKGGAGGTGGGDAKTTTAAPATEMKPFAWSEEILKLIASGNADKGKALAADAGCAGCHGEMGVSEDDNNPNLAGQVASYTFKQLHDFKQGARQNELMADPVRDLTPAQMADLAAWYGGLPAAALSANSNGASTPVLVSKGDKSRLLIACDICHGKNGKGRKFEVPAIGGQKRAYFLKTMQAFKIATRKNDHYGRMRFIANILTDKEIEEIAAHYGQATQAAGVTLASAKPRGKTVAGAGASAAGAKAWKKCKSCHTIDKGGRNKLGPNLYGVMDTKAARNATFKYSKTLKKRGAEGLIWTDANMDAWLENPKKFIGGRTKMSKKTRNAADRAALIDYLKAFSDSAKK